MEYSSIKSIRNFGIWSWKHMHFILYPRITYMQMVFLECLDTFGVFLSWKWYLLHTLRVVLDTWIFLKHSKGFYHQSWKWHPLQENDISCTLGGSLSWKWHIHWTLGSLLNTWRVIVMKMTSLGHLKPIWQHGYKTFPHILNNIIQIFIHVFIHTNIKKT